MYFFPTDLDFVFKLFTCCQAKLSEVSAEKKNKLVREVQFF